MLTVNLAERFYNGTLIERAYELCDGNKTLVLRIAAIPATESSQPHVHITAAGGFFDQGASIDYADAQAVANILLDILTGQRRVA